MPDKHFVTVKVAVVKGKTLLLQREEHEEGLVYSMPGGRLDAGEDIISGLRREVREEIGVELSWISELPVKVYSSLAARKHGVVALIYQARLASEDFNYNTTDAPEVMGTAYVDKETVAASTSYVHKPFILEYFDDFLSE